MIHRPDRHRIALALASSLAAIQWTEPAIRLHLQNRLPPGAGDLATDLAAWLSRTFPKPYTPPVGALTRAVAGAPHLEATKFADILRRLGPAGPNAAIRPDPVPFRPTPAFSDLDLPALATTRDLADHLGLTGDQLTRFADLRGLSNRTDNAFAPHYRFHIIPKRKAGHRLIEEPKPVLKTLQRRVLSTVLDRIPPHPAAFGFTRSRTCIQAAAKHAGEAVVLRFDLKDYFGSIDYCRIQGLFRCLGYPDAVARHLTGLTTLATPPHILSRLPDRHALARRHLPQGAPTSPALANLCTYTLDRRLAGLARRLDACYTRYADDLTFSGDRSIAGPLLKAVPGIVADERFLLNTTKTRVMPYHKRQTVTGIVINRHTNLARADYDRLKATLHRLSQGSALPDPALLHRLDGQIAWAEALNPARGARLRASFDALGR